MNLIKILLVFASLCLLISCTEVKTEVIFSCKSPSQNYDAKMIVERFGGAVGGSSSQIIIKNAKGEGARYEDQVFLSEAHATLALAWSDNDEITIYYQEPILVKHWQNWFDASVDRKVNLVSFRDKTEIENIACKHTNR